MSKTPKFSFSRQNSNFSSTKNNKYFDFVLGIVVVGLVIIWCCCVAQKKAAKTTQYVNNGTGVTPVANSRRGRAQNVTNTTTTTTTVYHAANRNNDQPKDTRRSHSAPPKEQPTTTHVTKNADGSYFVSLSPRWRKFNDNYFGQISFQKYLFKTKQITPISSSQCFKISMQISSNYFANFKISRSFCPG